MPLSVDLGPGIVEQIVDGIQRPLRVIAEVSGSVFVPKGVDVPALDLKKLWAFKANSRLKIGHMVVGGDIIGSCFENNLFDEHRIMVPPRAKGKITFLAPDGEYTITDKVLELEYEGKNYQFTMAH